MGIRALFRRVNPFSGVAGMVVTGVLLVTTIFFTWFDLPWVAFLSGILSAAVVALLNRVGYAEQALENVRESVRYFDEELPVMIAYVTADGIVRFHNQAFRYWLRARRAAINGRALREVVGLTTFGQIKPALDAALEGRLSQEVRTHELRDGGDLRFFTQYVPHAGDGGAIIGAFILQTDVTALAQVAMPSTGTDRGEAHPTMPAVALPAVPAPVPGPEPAVPRAGNGDGPERLIFVNTMREELTDWARAGERLRAALDNDEFCLYYQAIRPVNSGGEVEVPFYEILLRLREEEEGLMPPGAFLPLAEEYGLLPELDRWVVKNVLDWACALTGRLAGRFSINVSAPTIAMDSFPAFVAGELGKRGLPGSLLCFEIPVAVALLNRAEANRFVSALSAAGCLTALCGFGQTAASYNLLKHLRVDYLKIDGDLVLGLTRNPMDLIKLKAIARVARSTDRRTIAEFVESEETLAKLREYGVDFAQGFGISRPAPLAELP